MGLRLGGGGNAFAFEKIGDSVTGTIVDWADVQQTHFAGPDKGKPAFWPDGKPKMQHRVTLQTSLRDDQGDDGRRSVYLRGSQDPASQSTLAAVIGAMRDAGVDELEEGGTLTLTFVGERPGDGSNAKCYTATYRAPGLALAPTAGAVPPPPAPVAPAPPPPPAPTAAVTPDGYTLDGLVAAGWTREQALAAYPMLAPVMGAPTGPPPPPPAATSNGADAELAARQAAALAALTPEQRAIAGL